MEKYWISTISRNSLATKCDNEPRKLFFTRMHLFLTAVLLLTVIRSEASRFSDNNADSLKVGEIINGVPVITTSANLQSAIEQALNDGTDINTVRIDTSGTLFYLIGDGFANDTLHFIIAVELKSSGTELWLKPAIDSHSCSASSTSVCSCCKFIKNYESPHEILGCECRQSLQCYRHGDCIHTVKSDFSNQMLIYL